MTRLRFSRRIEEAAELHDLVAPALDDAVRDLYELRDVSFETKPAASPREPAADRGR